MNREHACWDRYGLTAGKRRSKEDWAGISFRDAFKANLDYSVRLAAQRQYYKLCKATQIEVVRHIDPSANQHYSPKIKPQIGPAYTSYPSALAVTASIGLTGYLEYQQCMKEKILMAYLTNYLNNPSEEDQVHVDPETYKKVARIVAESVQARLLLEALSQLSAAGSIEIYRYFLASQETSKFQSLPEIIRAVVLFGDLLPDWSKIDLHPMKIEILKNLTTTSASFIDKLARTKPHKFVEMGSVWVRAICRSLVCFLPLPEETVNKPVEGDTSSEPKWIFSNHKKRNTIEHAEKIGPLNAKQPPTLFENESPLEKFAQAYGLTKEEGKAKETQGNAQDKNPQTRIFDIVEKLAKAIDQAGGQTKMAEDMRSDLVEAASRTSGFKESPLQGNPVDGSTVTVPLGENQIGMGEIYDRAVELSDDFIGLETLLESSRPLTEQLRRVLFPNLVHMPEMERIRCSGALDPGRLPLGDVCTAVFRRYKVNMQPDRRGTPVLLIVCDGSGSLTREPTWMLKNIACAWLNATVGKSILILAGIYNTDMIRNGVYGPLVKWLYHPQKTPAIGRRDATKALVSLPNSGTGGQADVLSLAFMLREADEIARGRMIYLVHITDCGWCSSFQHSKSSREEVYDYYQATYKMFEGRLHTTLVALGVEKETGLEDLLDKVIPINRADLANPTAVAEKISLYVASCMRERRKRTGTR